MTVTTSMSEPTERLTPSQQILRYFAYDHLPQALKEISAEVAYVAHRMEGALPDGPEKTVGLRKLLEAKDCFVRAALPPAPAYPLIGARMSSDQITAHRPDTYRQRNAEGTA